jgi:hypothetical protein
MFDRRYYYWINKSLTKHTKEFFGESYKNVSSDVYKKYENVFMLLIHNTKTGSEIRSMTKKNSGKVAKLFEETFGQKPNLKNLREFFKHDVI